MREDFRRDAIKSIDHAADLLASSAKTLKKVVAEQGGSELAPAVEQRLIEIRKAVDALALQLAMLKILEKA